MSAGSSRREEGAALVFVVLMMLALLALAHGALVAALAELSGSRAAVRQLRLRAAADHALAATLAKPPGPWLDSLARWEVRTDALGPVGGTQTQGAVRRLGVESWLLEGSARDSSGVTTRKARLAWALDPLARVTELRGAATVAPWTQVTVTGILDASAPAGVAAPLQPADCGPWQSELASHFGAVPLTGTAPPADTTTPLALGLLDFGRLLEAAAVDVTGSGTPAPSETLGACLVGEPWGWGDPDRPWRPCGPHLPMRRSAGDLRVVGGVGQGILVVDGDLTLEAGARYYGLVVTRGIFRLTGGANFDGLALSAGGLTVEAGSTLRGSACWAVRALEAGRGALGGFVPVSSGPIGPT